MIEAENGSVVMECILGDGLNGLKPPLARPASPMPRTENDYHAVGMPFWGLPNMRLYNVNIVQRNEILDAMLKCTQHLPRGKPHVESIQFFSPPGGGFCAGPACTGDLTATQ